MVDDHSSISTNIVGVNARRAVRLLVLGGDPDAVSAPDALQVSGDPEQGFDVVVLVGPVASADLWRALQAGHALLAPVIDFSGMQIERADAHFPSMTASVLRDALLSIAPIVKRVAGIDDISDHPDRERLYALGIAHSRQQEIAASWTANVPEGVGYPLLGVPAGSRRTLEALADLDLLSRTFFGRTNQCAHCASARLNAFEACGKCGSANLRMEQLVHHYSCGAQGPESTFLDGERLICPKCRKELRHIGVDYDRPGSLFVCNACEDVSTDPDVHFVCLDCGKLTPSEGANTLDHFNYRITPDGVAALKAGRLPHPTLLDAPRAFPGTLAVRDFLLVVNKELRVASHYDREFSLARLQIENDGALREQYGGLSLDESASLLVRLCVEAMRDSDFATVTPAREIFVAFPEMDIASVEKTLANLRRTVAEVLALPLKITASVVGRDDVPKMLESCR